MELLCAALEWEAFREAPELQVMREQLTSLLFKNLMSVHSEIHNVAKKGLQLIIQYQKMPKGLLQVSLRPILQNLASYKNLNLNLLKVSFLQSDV